MKRMMITSVHSVGICLMLAAVPQAHASGHGCSFKETLRQSGYQFDVSSRPAAGCAVQVIEVAVRQGGKTLAKLKSDVDFLAETAWATDLDGDSRPELAVASRSVRSGGQGTFDVYWFEGNSLRRATLPVNEEGPGYRGHDKFLVAGHKIERTFPVYRDGDPDGRPSNGSRSILYQYRAGRIVNIKSDESADMAAPALAPAARESAEASATTSQTEERPTAMAATARPIIQGITSGQAYIDIRANGRITEYKLLTLARPARLAIDIPGGRSAMADQVVPIGQNGIKRVRIGDNPGFLRVVLDARQAKFPAHTVTATEQGLRIAF